MSYAQDRDRGEGAVAPERHLGKYRGVVVENSDPDGLGRIRALVPDVLGDDPCGWALPCVPYAGPGVGFLMIPPEKALVWIEFESGDLDYPIWTGCFWGARSELPGDQPAGPDQKLICTDSTRIQIKESGGSPSLLIETSAGLRIEVSANEVEITNTTGATIKLAQSSVSINDGALEVM